MKKHLLLISGIALSISSMAQLLVDTTQAENKNVLLEEYTGRNCSYCPDGHKIANNIKEANPQDIILIRVHTGGYAPTSYPNFNTSFGTPLADQSGISGYPTGTINRHVFSGSSTSMSRSAWSSVSNQVLLETAVVNIGMDAVVDTANRKLYVEVEMYYTGNQSVSFNRLNVAILQDNIYGSQAGASYFNPDDGSDASYNHKHILRHLPLGTWGEQIDSISPGTFVRRTVSYVLPESISGVELKLEDLNIAAFVTEDKREVQNATHVKPRLGSAVSINEFSVKPISLYPNPASDKLNVEFEIRRVSDVNIKLHNLLGQTVFSTNKTFSSGQRKFQINVSDLETGIYMLELSNGAGTSTQKVIIK